MYKKFQIKIYITVILILRTLSQDITKTCKSLKTFNKLYKNEMNGQTLEILYQNVENSPLGVGGNGQSFQIKWNNKDATLKLVKGDPDEQSFFAEEIDFHRELNGDSIPDFIDCVYFITSNELRVFTIQELLTKDLDDEDFKDQFKNFETDQKGLFLKLLFSSLTNLYNQEIVHNDLKPKHIMLTNKGKIKIIAFGMAGYVGSRTYHTTNCYDYPKSKQNGDPKFYNNKAFDVYSMAVTTAVLRTNFNTVCYGYFQKRCQSRYWERECFVEVFKGVMSVMKIMFGTKERGKYDIMTCRDYGCVVMACLRFEVQNVPDLRLVLEAFDRVKRYRDDRREEKERVIREREKAIQFDKRQKIIDGVYNERKNLLNIEKEKKLKEEKDLLKQQQQERRDNIPRPNEIESKIVNGKKVLVMKTSGQNPRVNRPLPALKQKKISKNSNENSLSSINENEINPNDNTMEIQPQDMQAQRTNNLIIDNDSSEESQNKKKKLNPENFQNNELIDNSSEEYLSSEENQNQDQKIENLKRQKSELRKNVSETGRNKLALEEERENFEIEKENIRREKIRIKIEKIKLAGVGQNLGFNEDTFLKGGLVDGSGDDVVQDAMGKKIVV